MTVDRKLTRCLSHYTDMSLAFQEGDEPLKAPVFKVLRAGPGALGAGAINPVVAVLRLAPRLRAVQNSLRIKYIRCASFPTESFC